MPTGGIRARTSGIMIPAFVAPATAPFQGVGDLVSGWYGWWGFRAYTAALRGPTNLVMRLRFADTNQSDYGTDATTGYVPTSTIDTDIAAHGGSAKIMRLYDQTGNGRHLNTDAGGGEPNYTASAIGSLSALTFTGGDMNLEGSAVTFAQPFVVAVVTKRTSAFTSVNYVFTASAAGELLLGFQNTNDTMILGTDSTMTASGATDNVLHSVLGTYNGNVSASELYINGVATAGNGGNLGPSARPIGVGSVPFGSALNGIIAEAGVYQGSLLSSGQKTSIYTNQKAYYTGIP